MKSAYALLVLAANSAAAVVEPRQASKYTFQHESLTPALRQNAKRTLTRIGPIQFTGARGMSMDPAGQSFMLSIPKGTFCEGKPCTILTGKVGLQFENKTAADPNSGIYIHHILASNSNKKIEPFVSGCDVTPDKLNTLTKPGARGASFVGGSEDNAAEPIMYTTIDGTMESGYWFSPNDAIGVMMDIVRNNKQVQKLYLTYDLEWLPSHIGADSQGVLMSVTGCGLRSIKTSSAGPVNTTSNYFKFFRDGFLANGKGHLHDGGSRMIIEVFDNSGKQKKATCVSNAQYGGAGHGMSGAHGEAADGISGMSVCRGPIEVKAGDTMQMISEYDLKKYPLRVSANGKKAEVMGMWTMTFIPKSAKKN